MHIGGFQVSGILAFAILALARDALAGPAVATRWQQTDMTHDECLRRAEEAISRTGFERPERTSQSRYGSIADYTAAVRCVVGHGIVFFIVSGPSLAQANGMAGILFQNFDTGKKK